MVKSTLILALVVLSGLNATQFTVTYKDGKELKGVLEDLDDQFDEGKPLAYLMTAEFRAKFTMAANKLKTEVPRFMEFYDLNRNLTDDERTEWTTLYRTVIFPKYFQAVIVEMLAKDGLTLTITK